MSKKTWVLAGAMLLSGCTMAGMNPSKQAEADRNAVAAPTATELAAYAGHAVFPSTQPVHNDMQLAAIISADKTTIKIYNFTGDPMRSIDVWVNGSYVQHLAGISPQSSVLIHTDELYNGLGKTFAGQSEPVSKVQIATGSGVYDTWGPASD